MTVKIALAAAGVIAALAAFCRYQSGVIDTERQLRHDAEDRLSATMEALSAADKATTKLTAQIAKLRTQTAAKEDRINAQIKQQGKTDPCLDRHVSPDIIDSLRRAP